MNVLQLIIRPFSRHRELKNNPHTPAVGSNGGFDEGIVTGGGLYM